MWTMVKKEFRENLPWSAIGLIAMLYVVRPFFITDFEGAVGPFPRTQYYGEGEFMPILPLINGSFLSTLGIFAGVYGIALGLLQTLREERADTYSFVLARPIGRPAAIGAKLIAGASLYLLAACLPFCWAIYWTSVPGHFPSPFRWWMTYNGWEKIGGGLLFYLGAFLTGVRPARWVGTRLVGLVGVVASLIVIAVMAESRFVPTEAGIAIAAGVFLWAIFTCFSEREF